MRSGIEVFDQEWQAAQEAVIERCLAILADVGMSEEGLRYVRDMKGYPRIPYFTALWVMDAERRKELGIAVCIHAIGIKLIDDLVDKDQDISHWDQALGVFLLQSTMAMAGRYDSPRAVLDVFEEDYRVIWRKQLEEMRQPAFSMDSWVDYASVKSGLMLANYAGVACLAGGVPESQEAARTFAEAFGVLFMMGDDLRDYQELHETGGNLSHLVVTGQISHELLLSTINYWHTRAVEALRSRPIAHDVTPFVDDFVQKIVAIAMQLPASDALANPARV